jgi:hypothetical protein
MKIEASLLKQAQNQIGEYWRLISPGFKVHTPLIPFALEWSVEWIDLSEA